MDYQQYIKLLNAITLPALGCTEPAALAYAASLSREKISGEINAINLKIDKNLYKNSLRVTIPKTNLKGPDYAVALGAIGGISKYKLEVFRDIDQSNIEAAQDLVAMGKVNIELTQHDHLFIEVSIISDSNNAICRIEKGHSNVTALEINGRSVIDDHKSSGSEAVYQNNFGKLSIHGIVDFVENVASSDLFFLRNGCAMNYEAAMLGLENPERNYFSKALNNGKEYNESEMVYEDLGKRAKLLATAACDARMNGKDYPITSIAGSGNLGITATLPLVVISKGVNSEDDLTFKAIALSLLVTYYIKNKLGILSSVCGCVVAGGTGTAAGLTYLLGGSKETVSSAIKNMLGTVAGMICDGAKGGCALKVSFATSAAIESANLALKGVYIQPRDGFISDDIEETIDKFAIITNQGMSRLGDVLLRVVG